MVSLRRHTHLRLCYGRTTLPKFSDIRAAQNSSQARSESVHCIRSNDVNHPGGNTTATWASSKIVVLALPVFETVGNESGQPRKRLRIKIDGNSLRPNKSLSRQVKSLPSQVKDSGTDVSLSSQVRSLQSQVIDPDMDVSPRSQVTDPDMDVSLTLSSQVNDPDMDVSLSSQVKSLQSQLNDPGMDVSLNIQVKSLQSQVQVPDSYTVQLEKKIDRVQAIFDKLKEENRQQKAETDTEKQQADLEMLEFEKLLLQMVEKLCGNVDLMQQVDLMTGEPNKIQLRELLQKLEKLRQDLRSVG